MKDHSADSGLRSNFYTRLAHLQHKAETSKGAILPAIVLSFIIIAGIIALVNRTTFGAIGSFFSREIRLAREAAEIGISRTNAILNEPVNRRLLVNAGELTSKTGNQIQASPSLVSDCTSLPPQVEWDLAKLKELNSSGFPVVQIDARRRYQIVSISNDNSSTESSPDFNVNLGSSSGSANSGLITIRVKGESLNNSGDVVGVYEVTRAYEVLPKCCGLSLGGKNTAFGGDKRQCDLSPGFGVLAGTWLKNAGLIDTTGGRGIGFWTYNEDGTLRAIDQIYCIDNSSTNNCAGPSGIDSEGGTQVKEINAELPPVPATSNSTCSGVRGGNCDFTVASDLTLSTSDFANWGGLSTTTLYSLSTVVTTSTGSGAFQTSSQTTYIRSIVCTARGEPYSGQCRSAGQSVAAVPRETITSTVTFTTTGVYTLTNSSVSSISVGTSVFPSDPLAAQLKSLCSKSTSTLNGSDYPVINCSLDRLEIRPSRLLSIDTTALPIRFYFPNSCSTRTSKCIELNGGNGGIVHVGGSRNDYSRFMLLGTDTPNTAPSGSCPVSPSPCQIVDVGTGTVDASNLFVYFPSGKVEMLGTASFSGMIWAEDMDFTGSPDLFSTSTGVGSVFNALGNNSQDSSSSKPLLVEYVTRATRRFSFF